MLPLPIAGVLHAEEKDFKTSYSYFYEAFESYDSIDNPNAVLALKYMLLCKIMLNKLVCMWWCGEVGSDVPSMCVCVCVCSAEDVQSIVTGKLALKYTGVQIEAIQSIARASQNRSIAEFEKVLLSLRRNERVSGCISCRL